MHSHWHVAGGIVDGAFPDELACWCVFAGDPVERADLFGSTDGAGGREARAGEEGDDVVRGGRVGLRRVGGELDEVGGPGDVRDGEGFEGGGVGGAPDVA